LSWLDISNSGRSSGPSASSKLAIGVGERSLGWETSLNKEVPHVQEVRRSSFR
jgi:hypothetical protein